MLKFGEMATHSFPLKLIVPVANLINMSYAASVACCDNAATRGILTL